MLKLTDREWRAFKLEELFEIKGSKTTHISIIKNLKEGKYPYITTQTNNNGQAKYTKLYTVEKQSNFNNILENIMKAFELNDSEIYRSSYVNVVLLFILSVIN